MRKITSHNISLGSSGCFPGHVGGDNESNIPKVKGKSQLIAPSYVGLLEGEKKKKKPLHQT